MRRWTERLAFFYMLIFAQAAAGDAGFHAPVTESEKTIAEILALDAQRHSHSELLYYLTGYQHTPDEQRYSGLVTDALKHSITDAEQRLVQKNCGGEYIKGEICGLDIDPVSCTNDSIGAYLFRTEKQTDREAIISYQWPGDHNAAATFRLRKLENRWKLDAVSCSGYMKFNWNDDK